MKLLIPLAFITTLAGAAPFTPDLDSLKQYRCPDWFRDAKFGIWAHWGPQAVPMDGDWYARGMYEPGNGHYRHHLETYGHPSVHGYKDIIPLWKAEKWDPERLMDLYQKAGAKYFVSMGSHHDNFSLWNDKFHRWNAVEMGPKRDIVGEWRAAARKRGLKFGVSEHLAASYTWFQTSHGSDAKGDKAGIPYDGADPAYADLYHPPATPGDTAWYSTNEVWHAEWSRRITGLLTDYQPDLLYSDGGLPFGITGRRLLAEYYNRGTPPGADGPQVVYTCKSLHGNFENNQFVKEFCVPDVERGGMAGIEEEPWQTDTSIGDWYCNRNWKPRGADWVVRALADIVSKNGNLLLNVELQPDGSLAPDVEKTLLDLAGWMAVNGDAIFGTRPWKIHGEGPTRLKAGHFNDSFAFKARDIRFTTRGAALYAIALGWPEEGKLTIRSLAKPNDVTSVKLLGHAAPLVWTQTEKGLEIVLPEKRTSEIAIAFEIRGRQLAPVAWVDAIRPGRDGVITLTPDASGQTTEIMEGRMNIGCGMTAPTRPSGRSISETRRLPGLHHLRRGGRAQPPGLRGGRPEPLR
ncbi:MAG: alpha-L-fucosidase [Kiritimatiellia bacterium]